MNDVIHLLSDWFNIHWILARRNTGCFQNTDPKLPLIGVWHWTRPLRILPGELVKAGSDLNNVTFVYIFNHIFFIFISFFYFYANILFHITLTFSTGWDADSLSNNTTLFSQHIPHYILSIFHIISFLELLTRAHCFELRRRLNSFGNMSFRRILGYRCQGQVR